MKKRNKKHDPTALSVGMIAFLLVAMGLVVLAYLTIPYESEVTNDETTQSTGVIESHAVAQYFADDSSRAGAVSVADELDYCVLVSVPTETGFPRTVNGDNSIRIPASYCVGFVMFLIEQIDKGELSETELIHNRPAA